MRIGTWNLAGRWDERHEKLLLDQQCDVWLLTEVRDDVALPGFERHSSTLPMLKKKAFAAVLAAGELVPLPDPHPASALALVDGVRFCSSILPWRSCGTDEPWGDGNHADRVERTLRRLLDALGQEPVVWGGDWNHSLAGDEGAGSKAGREHLLAALDELELVVPTRELLCRVSALLSIDHVAVPVDWTVLPALHVPGVDEIGTRLSDHDAYVVEVHAP